MVRGGRKGRSKFLLTKIVGGEYFWETSLWTGLPNRRQCGVQEHTGQKSRTTRVLGGSAFKLPHLLSFATRVYAVRGAVGSDAVMVEKEF